MNEVFECSVSLPVPAARAMAWHERPGALVRLTPPWERVEIIHHPGNLRDGSRAELRSRWGLLWLPWSVEHYGYEKGRQFCDRQMAGPFAQWEHQHLFEDDGAGGCVLTERIHYRLPGGPLGRLARGHVRRRLERLFAYRHEVTRTDLALPRASRGRVLVSGASGLLGRMLVPFLQTQGWQVDRLVRRSARAADEIEWIPTSGLVHWPVNYYCDAVIHLAGENLAGGRWNSTRRAVLHQSRIAGTRTLVDALGQLARPPRVLLSASAIGYYGDRGEEPMNEDSASGTGFLADLCAEWEGQAQEAERLGLRVVCLRTGIVLTQEGGALAKLLPLYRIGLGGPLGRGDMWQSWIGREDWLRVVRLALVDDSLHGSVNLVTPEPLRQRDWARTLGRVLCRPAAVPTPPTLLRLLYGELADEALLASVRVKPGVLLNRGFEFLHPSLENALRHVLGRQP
jgi:uncharacterized protein (TIGR01777 family)